MIEDFINYNNHEKFVRYNELLFDALQSIPDGYKKFDDLLLKKIKDSGHKEHNYLINALSSWQNKWDGEIDLTSVKVGDYFMNASKDHMSYRGGCFARLYHITDIRTEVIWGVEKTNVYYESILIQENGVTVRGENIQNCGEYNNHDDSCPLKHFCMQVHDHIYERIDESVWNKALDRFNSHNDLYKELTKNYKDGNYSRY